MMGEAIWPIERPSCQPELTRDDNSMVGPSLSDGQSSAHKSAGRPVNFPIHVTVIGLLVVGDRDHHSDGDGDHNLHSFFSAQLSRPTRTCSSRDQACQWVVSHTVTVHVA